MNNSSPFRRIVSLAPAITETLFHIGCGNNVVGRTEYCDWPEEATSVPIIGGFISVDVQSILNRTPDMVIGTSIHRNILNDVRKSGINAAAIPAYPVYGAPFAIRSIGHAVKLISESERVAGQIEEEIAHVKQLAFSLSSKRVCYLCNISCPSWYACPVASSVEFLNCPLAGRKPPPTRDGDKIIGKIIDDEPEVFVIPECQNCRKECIDSLLTKNKTFKEYLASRKPLITSIGSKLLGRAGPRAAQALDMLGRAIFNETWKRRPYDK
jgi:iron complex transport system substrate-binding protein